MNETKVKYIIYDQAYLRRSPSSEYAPSGTSYFFDMPSNSLTESYQWFSISRDPIVNWGQMYSILKVHLEEVWQEKSLFYLVWHLKFCFYGVILKIFIYTRCGILNVTYIQVCGSFILWYP
jgi:hypothetical protein